MPVSDEYRIRAIVYPERLADNVRLMKQHVPSGTAFMAVIKADAYGHGAVMAANALKEEADWFAVATAEEALTLREAGLTKPILILGFVEPACYPEMVREAIRVTVLSLEEAKALSEAAEALGLTAFAHVPVDTGMSRIGVTPDDAGEALIRQMAALPHLRVEGVFTHFAKADEPDPEATERQLARFEAFRERLKDVVPLWHCANSAAILRGIGTGFNLVRGGISMYGLDPMTDGSTQGLKPVMELKSRVVYVKTIPEGTEVSYGGTYVAQDERVIATIPVGYADGYRRGLSNHASVLIRGQRAAVIGRVCMDQLMADVTDIPGVAAGDEVTLIGRDGDEEITAGELAKICGTIHYEITCGVSARVPRIEGKD